MSSATHRTAFGLLPSVNDAAAGFVIAFTYLIRITAGSTADWVLPWYLTATTDALLPLLAGVWLWVYSMYLLTKRDGRQEAENP